MEFPVDIVVPWLNPTSRWFNAYKTYRGNENIGRVRDLGTFRYVLRSITNNMPWVNNIFILLYDAEQKPDWLVESDRLRVVYHKDFLPSEYVPNFNSLVTDMHICFIKDISEHFIFINDDMFFMRPIPRDMFFTENGNPVHHPSLHSGVFTRYNSAQFRYIEENMFNFVSGIVGTQVLWNTFHMPIPFRKSFQQFIWNKYGRLIRPMLANSHIRSNTNICNWVFYGLEEALGMCHINRIYDQYPCTCFDLVDGMRDIPERISNKYIVCLNDGDFLTYDFDHIKHDIVSIMDKCFPVQCRYERKIN